LAIKLTGLQPGEASFLAAEAMGLGGRAIIEEGGAEATLLGGRNLLQALSRRAREEARHELAAELEGLMSPPPPPELRCGPFRLPIGRKTFIMGIINITDDSFSGDGLLGDPRGAVERGCRFVAEGADILDIGGETARADRPVVAAGEEIRRVVPVIEALREAVEVPIAVDTYKPQVAEAAVRAGAVIINDISGLSLGLETARIAARYGVALVITHTYERPKVRPPSPPQYRDLMTAIFTFLKERLALAQGVGVPWEALIVDPGIAFGKSHDEDLEVVRRLGELRWLRRPILLAPSRKHFIGSVLGLPPGERVEGTLAVASLAIAQGVDILRVHDVKAVARAARMADAIIRGEQGDFAPSPDSWPYPAQGPP